MAQLGVQTQLGAAQLSRHTDVIDAWIAERARKQQNKESLKARMQAIAARSQPRSSHMRTSRQALGIALGAGEKADEPASKGRAVAASNPALCH